MVTNNIVSVFVYSFHVPAFFVISGFVFKRKENFWKFLKKKFFGLMIPYYIASLLSILVFMILGKFASGSLGVDVKSTEFLPSGVEETKRFETQEVKIEF